ncbi:MAG: MBL fold metallo-hydrolase [Pseudooceanicola sp.]|jgi:glyoxylase-like metal-dependent hydrolase (beta-lactamase superfamily II)|nr:MBL fold metallo-hydrolase [Pseudooceanicola sp.]
MLAPDDFDPPVLVPEEIAPGLRRIVAPNPSPMTYRGTNTYLLGTTDIAVIDPGPLDTAHLDAICAAIGPSQRLSHIIVTHTHLDHSPLARPLANRTGAPVLAFGDATAGRSTVMAQLADAGIVSGGEGIDHDFAPDQTIEDGEVISAEGWSLRVIHTPGHLGNHVALGWGNRCFTADHVMGWATSIVSPPDGDLTDFMASCQRLRTDDWEVFYPGHGAPVNDPRARLDWLIAHRLSREASILDQLGSGPATAEALARAIYTETPAALLPAATRNVLAHLVDLKLKNRASPIGPLSETARFQLMPDA